MMEIERLEYIEARQKIGKDFDPSYILELTTEIRRLSEVIASLKKSLDIADQMGLAAAGHFEHGGVKSILVLEVETNKWLPDFASRLINNSPSPGAKRLISRK